MNIRRAILVMSIMILHGACSRHVPVMPVQEVTIAEMPSQETALEYYNRIVSLSRAEQQSEYEQLARDRWQLDRIVYTTRRGLLLTVLESYTDSNEQRALDTFNELNGYKYQGLNELQRGYLRYGHVWKELLKNRQYLREAYRELADTRRDVTDLTTENEELKRQIKALKMIEQQLNQHEQMQE